MSPSRNLLSIISLTAGLLGSGTAFAQPEMHKHDSPSVTPAVPLPVASLPIGAIEIPNAAQPQLVAGTDNRVWLTYGQAKDVFVARSDDGGKTFSAGVKVANLPDLMLGKRRGPRISVSGNRVTLTVVAPDLIAFVSADGGKTWSAPTTINQIPGSAREGLHNLAGSQEGRTF